MRTASDVLRSLEQRIARLEGRRTAATSHNRLAAGVGLELSTLNPLDMKSVNLAEEAGLNNTYEGISLRVLVPKIDKRLQLVANDHFDDLAKLQKGERTEVYINDIYLINVVYYAEQQVFGFGYYAIYDEVVPGRTTQGIGSYTIFAHIKNGEVAKVNYGRFTRQEGKSLSLLESQTHRFGKPMLKLL